MAVDRKAVVAILEDNKKTPQERLEAIRRIGTAEKEEKASRMAPQVVDALRRMSKEDATQLLEFMLRHADLEAVNKVSEVIERVNAAPKPANKVATGDDDDDEEEDGGHPYIAAPADKLKGLPGYG